MSSLNAAPFQNGLQREFSFCSVIRFLQDIRDFLTLIVHDTEWVNMFFLHGQKEGNRFAVS